MKTSVPAPDPRTIAAQTKMSDIAQQAEDRAKSESAWYQQFSQNQADRANADSDWYKTNILPKMLAQSDQQLQLSKEEGGRQKELSDYTLGLSKKYDQRYWDTTAKQQDAFYDTVNNYDQAGERDRIGGQAVANVQQGLASQQQQLASTMARYGVNPGSAAWMSAMNDANLEGGASSAYARTMAESAARSEGLNLRSQAAGLGGNLTGASSGFAGQSSGMASAGTSAGAGGMQALGALQGSVGSNSNAWAGMMGNAGNTRTAGNSAWNGMMGAATNNYGNISNFGVQQQQMGLQANSQNANTMNSFINSGLKMGIGYMGGGAGGGGGFSGIASMFGGGTPSDRRLKTNIVRIGTRPDGLGVYEFDYVWGGARQRGVMADEVRQVYPGAVTNMGGYDIVNYAALGG